MKRRYVTFAITIMVAISSMIPVFAKTQRVFTAKQLESENHTGFIGRYETVNEDGSPVECWDAEEDHITAFKEGDIGKRYRFDEHGYCIECREDGYWYVLNDGRELFEGDYGLYERMRKAYTLKDGRCVFDLSPNGFKDNIEEIWDLYSENTSIKAIDENLTDIPESFMTEEQRYIFSDYVIYLCDGTSELFG